MSVWILIPVTTEGCDSSVGIATRYGLDGRGSNPGGGEIFRTCPDRPCGLPNLQYNGYRVSFPGVKWPGRDVNHQPPSSAVVKERVELYLYLFLWDFMDCSWGRTLPLPFFLVSLLLICAPLHYSVTEAMNLELYYGRDMFEFHSAY